MGLLDRIIYGTPIKKVEAQKNIPAPIAPLHHSYIAVPDNAPKGSLLLRPNLQGMRSELKNYAYLYDNSPWVSTVIDLISAAAAKGYHLARKDGKPNDPKDVAIILSFLEQPNLEDTLLSLFRKIIQDLLIFGSTVMEFHVNEFDKQAFARSLSQGVAKSLDFSGGVNTQLVEDAMSTIPIQGFPTYLAILPREQVEVRTDSKGQIEKYVKWNTDGTFTDYQPSEIIQIFHPKSRDLVDGQSPLSGLLEILLIDSRKDTRQLKIITNESMINKWVTLPAGSAQEEIQKIQRTIDAYYQAHGSTSDAFVITNDIEAKVLTEGTKEGDFLKLSLQIRDRVCAKFGVPVGMLNDTGTSSAASVGVAQQFRFFVENAVRGVAEHAATILNRKLFPHFGQQIGTDYVLQLDLLDADDMGDLQKTLDLQLRNGSLSINECRQAQGLQPVAGGDTNFIYTAQGAVTLDMVINPPAPSPPPAKPEVQQAIVDAKKALKIINKSLE